MVSVRAAKSKGAQFEYSAKDSLVKVFPDILLTKEIGFVKQYDLASELEKSAFECKRHKGFTWNKLEKLFKKLEKKAKDYSVHYLIFQGNRQPPCVMLRDGRDKLLVMKFEDWFETPWIKHNGKNN